MDMLTINVSELILTILNFFLLMFLLKRFLYTPIIAFMDERNARIEAGLNQEKEALTAVEEQTRQHEVQRRESINEAKRILSQAKVERELQHTQATAQAKAQSVHNRKEAQAAARTQSETERQLLTEHRDELAGLLAEQLLCPTSGKNQ